jgi:methyl-accepting chemotaxis protein
VDRASQTAIEKMEERPMKRTPRASLVLALLAAAALPRVALAEGTAAAAAPPAAADDLTAQDREMLAGAKELAAETTQILERWIASKSVTEERLFSRLYYPILLTDPLKYTTDYDQLADRDFIGPEEKMLGRFGSAIYAVITDVNGYLPTHNQRYSQPITGNRAVDLLNNRTKRIFGDRTGFAAARSEAPYLIQKYKRDTGEVMADVSVPVMLRGKHWGCVRIGYRRDEK